MGPGGVYRSLTWQPGPPLALSAREVGAEEASTPLPPTWPSSLLPCPILGPASFTLILLPGCGKGTLLPGLGLFSPASLLLTLCACFYSHLPSMASIAFLCILPQLSSPERPSLLSARLMDATASWISPNCGQQSSHLPSESPSQEGDHLPLLCPGWAHKSPPSCFSWVLSRPMAPAQV